MIVITTTNIFAGLKTFDFSVDFGPIHPSAATPRNSVKDIYPKFPPQQTKSSISSRKICFSEDVGSFPSANGIQWIYLNKSIQQIYSFIHFRIMKLESKIGAICTYDDQSIIYLDAMLNYGFVVLVTSSPSTRMLPPPFVKHWAFRTPHVARQLWHNAGDALPLRVAQSVSFEDSSTPWEMDKKWWMDVNRWVYNFTSLEWHYEIFQGC